MDLLDWVLLIGRVVVVFAVLMVSVMFLTWMERKVIADMQTRMGPMRAGPRGILLPLADGAKLFFKEGIMPLDADRFIYWIAPVLALVPAFLGFAVSPFGAGATIAGREVPFQIANLSVGVLWVLAMSSIAVYGVVLAGWASASRYPLIGSVRSTAQMISYEVGMGLALVAVLMYSGSLNMNAIVEFQRAHVWNIIPQFPAFLVYLIAALAETNRPPFDLAEAESELVAGFHTEYSGIKLATFMLAEYLHTITISAIVVTLFLGGWSGPMFGFAEWLWPLVWFMLKMFAVLYLLMWVRATLPRFRYDRLMVFGWKVLIPVGLVWVMATGAIVILPQEYGKKQLLIGLVAMAAALIVAMLFWPSKKEQEVTE
ncbi:MAG: NADH-quinone oxidoreductase subunit NuoH [Actinobacteria bacterium]|nr:NADH-quinone oxidoreductase subunit NuoH [Actinomycetota bacterium]